MHDISVHSFIIDAVDFSTNGSRDDLISIPVIQFRWWIILCLVALHGVVAAITSELMVRSYGKWWIYVPVSFMIPFAGPVALFIYHLVLSGSVVEYRRKSFWRRLLSTGQVSLKSSLQREKEEADKMKLAGLQNRVMSSIPFNDRDDTIEKHLKAGEFAIARTYAWNMMERARIRDDDRMLSKYHSYLEAIADKESMEAETEREVTPAALIENP